MMRRILFLLILFLVTAPTGSALVRVATPVSPNTLVLWDNLDFRTLETFREGEVHEVLFWVSSDDATAVRFVLPETVRVDVEPNATGLRLLPRSDGGVSHEAPNPILSFEDVRLERIVDGARVPVPFDSEDDFGPSTAYLELPAAGVIPMVLTLSAPDALLPGGHPDPTWDWNKDGAFNETVGWFTVAQQQADERNRTGEGVRVGAVLGDVRINTALVLNPAPPLRVEVFQDGWRPGPAVGSSFDGGDLRITLLSFGEARSLSSEVIRFRLDDASDLDLHLRGELSRHNVMLYLDGELARDEDGLSIVSWGDDRRLRVSLAEGEHTVRLEAHGVSPGVTEGTLDLERGLTVVQSIPVRFENHTVPVLFPLLGLGLVGLVALRVRRRSRRSLVTTPTGTEVCVQAGTVRAVLAAGVEMVPVDAVPLTGDEPEHRAAKRDALERDHPEVLSVLTRPGSSALRALRPDALRFEADAEGVDCIDCPRRPVCWDPRKRPAQPPEGPEADAEDPTPEPRGDEQNP